MALVDCAHSPWDSVFSVFPVRGLLDPLDRLEVVDDVLVLVEGPLVSPTRGVGDRRSVKD